MTVRQAASLFRHASFIGCRLCVRFVLLLALLGHSVPVSYGRDNNVRSIDVEITRTRFHIPHIRARDFRSLGYGIGYAYTQDNLCLLSGMIITARGERSRYFGPGNEGEPRQPASNLQSDIFYKSYLAPARIAAIYSAISQPARELIEGYAAGYNHYLEVTPVTERPAECRSAPWVTQASTGDIFRLITDKMITTSAANFIGRLATTLPVDAQGAPDPIPPSTHNGPGSNGYALGKRLTENGTGILLANPHYPWDGSNRFYEMQLTIPGQLDVMGVTIPPLPAIVIGFNRDVAWTHTVSTGRRFTVYELTLNPQNKMEYTFDGHFLRIRREKVNVEVKQRDGILKTTSAFVFTSRFGPVLEDVRAGLVWDRNHAYSLKDALLPDGRAVDQWLGIDRATSTNGLYHTLLKWHGTPWVNTIAADKNGRVLYADTSIVPNVSDEMLRRCKPSQQGREVERRVGAPVLDGSRSECDWADAKGALQKGIIPAAEMPFIARDDYVLNSNDSFWLANARTPLTGFPSIIGAINVPQGLRTRMGYKELYALMRSKSGRISARDLENMVMNDRNLAAELTMSDLLTVCTREASKLISIDLACRVLSRWNQRDDAASKGAALFRQIWFRLLDEHDLWRIPFKQTDPLSTPSGLAINRPSVQARIVKAITDTVQQFKDLGLPLDVALGRVQSRRTPQGSIPLNGGAPFTGVLNLISLGKLTTHGYSNDAIGGSSYMQTVTWRNGHPICHALLAYGESASRDSPYYSDQTKLFLKKIWPRRPFTASEVAEERQSYTHIRLKTKQ